MANNEDSRIEDIQPKPIVENVDKQKTERSQTKRRGDGKGHEF